MLAAGRVALCVGAADFDAMTVIAAAALRAMADALLRTTLVCATSIGAVRLAALVMVARKAISARATALVLVLAFVLVALAADRRRGTVESNAGAGLGMNDGIAAVQDIGTQISGAHNPAADHFGRVDDVSLLALAC